jgi:hypothetical protein
MVPARGLNPEEDFFLIKKIESQPFEGDDAGEKYGTVTAARMTVQ